MKTLSYRILRFGLGVTFLWIGILILRDPLAWGSYIQPWALKLMQFPLATTMKISGGFDIFIGLWLMFGVWTRSAAFLASAHLALVLITTSGDLQTVIVRDIGLLAATLSLALHKTRHYDVR